MHGSATAKLARKYNPVPSPHAEPRMPIPCLGHVNLLRRRRCCCCCHCCCCPLCAAPAPTLTPATVTVMTVVTPTKKYCVYVEYRECSEHAVLGYLPSGVGIKLVGWLVGVTTVITLTAEEAGTKTETALRLLLLLLLLLPHRRDAADERVQVRDECRGGQSALLAPRPPNILRLSASAVSCTPRCALLSPSAREAAPATPRRCPARWMCR